MELIQLNNKKKFSYRLIFNLPQIKLFNYHHFLTYSFQDKLHYLYVDFDKFFKHRIIIINLDISTIKMKRCDFLKTLVKIMEFFFPIYLQYLSEIVNTYVQKNLKYMFDQILHNEKNSRIQNYAFQADFFLKHLLSKAEICLKLNFYSCLINNNLCFLQKYEDYILIFTRKLAFYKRFPITYILKIREVGDKAINLIFRNSKIKINFFTKHTKHLFINELLFNYVFPHAENISEEQHFIKKQFVSIISKNKMILYDIILFTEKMLRKSIIFYKSDIYNLVKFSHFYPFISKEHSFLLKKNQEREIFEMNYTLFYEFQFFINQQGVLSKMQRIIFYSFNILPNFNSFEIAKKRYSFDEFVRYY